MQRVAGSTLLALAAGVAVAGPGAPLAEVQAAAARGDPRAQTDLASRYENAEGVPKNLDKARALYCRAARRGDAEAQFRLGWIYANGRGVPRDDFVAATLFTLAAGQGNAAAKRMLRYMPRRQQWTLPACMLADVPVALKLDYDGLGRHTPRKGRTRR